MNTLLATAYPIDTLQDQHPQASTPPDLLAVGQWLTLFQHKSPHTHRAYQRAAAYWLYFLEQIHGHHPDLLRRAGPTEAHAFLQAIGHSVPESLRTALAFLQPGPEAQPNHFGIHENPFFRPKSSRSVAQLVSALSSLYRFHQTKRSAQSSTLWDFNPFADVGRFFFKIDAKTDRVFEPEVYGHMLETLDRLASTHPVPDSPLLAERVERLRWITVALFNLWLRVAELSQLRMGDFKQRGGVWVVIVHGKGRKIRTVEVTPGVMQALMRYRKSVGLPALPGRQENPIPAVLSLRRPETAWGDCLTSRALFGEIKQLGQWTAEALRQQWANATTPSPEQQSILDKLCEMSPHWFRHSGASEAINAQFSIADASERLGHQDPAITVRMYYHGDAKRRVRSLEALEKARGEKPE